MARNRGPERLIIPHRPQGNLFGNQRSGPAEPSTRRELAIRFATALGSMHLLGRPPDDLDSLEAGCGSKRTVIRSWDDAAKAEPLALQAGGKAR